MNAIHNAFAFFLICSSLNAGYLLKSELQRNFDGGSITATFLTAYTYDECGNRIEKNAFNGSDTASALMSTTEYVYNEHTGRLISEVLLMQIDTVSIVAYSYDDDGNTICISVLDGSGSENYRDSLSYDTGGNCLTKTRFSEGQQLFRHRISYDKDNHKISDTLYEASDGSFAPSQTTLFFYDDSGLVQSEKNYHRLDTSWFAARTALMAYSKGVLSSVTGFDGDGNGRRMLDSTAFFFDANSNKIREQRYDDERALISIIDYTWTLFVAVTERPRPQLHFGEISYRNGELQLTGYCAGNALVKIVDMRGRAVRHQTTVDGRTGVRTVKPSALSPGKYVVQAMTAAGRRSLSFVIAGR